MSSHYRIEDLDAMDDRALQSLPWKELHCLNGRLLQLHAEGKLGNEQLAKLPLPPILCVDRIDRIDETDIEASFTFPDAVTDWAFAADETLEMLFQDQLDQLVGFWGARKANGIGRALSSGQCLQQGSLDFQPGRKLCFRLKKRKWVKNSESDGGTAVFNGQILDSQDNILLETRNVIVGILRVQDVLDLRRQYGGTAGVSSTDQLPQNLRIPIHDSKLMRSSSGAGSLERVSATQFIDPQLWPLRYHFRGDPVVPGNFGTHGMISLLKQVAREDFGLDSPVFSSMTKKNFSGMIFEDPKQIRFELVDVSHDPGGDVVAKEANLYLENRDGSRMIETPIYTYRNLAVREG